MNLRPIYQATAKIIRVIQSCETLAQLSNTIRWASSVLALYKVSKISLECHAEIIGELEKHGYNLTMNDKDEAKSITCLLDKFKKDNREKMIKFYRWIIYE